MSRKTICLATVFSAAMIIPSYASSQVMPTSSTGVGTHFFAMGIDDVIRIKNDKDKDNHKKKADKGHGKKKHKSQSQSGERRKEGR